jgi:hypothetical protein
LSGVGVGSNLIAGTDATYDFGASGATRFRDFYLSRNAVIGGTLNVTGAITGALTGNASTATALATARAINGVNFDGTAPITVTAAAGTLTGGTLASGVTISSLVSFGTLGADVLFTDALYDIGKSAATRPRDFFLSRNATIGGTLNVTGAITGSLTGNADTATVLATARAINGVNFNGSAPITITAAAGTLTGGALASGVTTSSLGSFGTLGAVVLFTDALYDIGKSAATRPRDFFLSRNATIGGTLNVTGTITGSLSGNASTATALQTGRTIGGTSFDGSANITVVSATSGFSISGGSLLAANDATNDIGANGATRFRDLFLSRNAVIGGTLTVSTDIIVAAGRFIFPDGGGDTWIAESSANVVSHVAGGTTIFKVNNGGTDATQGISTIAPTSTAAGVWRFGKQNSDISGVVGAHALNLMVDGVNVRLATID